MNKSLLVILAGWLLPWAVLAQSELFTPQISSTDGQIARQLRQQGLGGQHSAYALVSSLTTEVGARPGGSSNDALAVKWALKKFRQLGFDKVWSEPVSFPYWRRGAESARLLTPSEQHLAITALGGSVGTPPEGISGEVLHFATLQDLEKANPAVVRGKIAFISNRMQRARDGSGYGSAVQARGAGPATAARLGALALVIRSIGTDNDRLPHTGAIRQPEDGQLVPSAALSNPDADQLVRLFERGIKPRMELKLDVGFDGEATSQNVFAEITGSKSEDFILLGAHLDSWDMGTGALDDGAGVAIVMAAGELLLKQPQRPSRSIRIGLFANEEQGLYGGRDYLAKQQAMTPSGLMQHVFAAESDLGAGRIYRIDARVNSLGWAMVQNIHRHLAPLGIELGENDKPGGSDIFPLIQAGVANIALRQDASEYFDIHHTDNDTLDKIDPESLNQNVSAYAVLTWLAANHEVGFGTGELEPLSRDE